MCWKSPLFYRNILATQHTKTLQFSSLYSSLSRRPLCLDFYFRTQDKRQIFYRNGNLPSFLFLLLSNRRFRPFWFRRNVCGTLEQKRSETPFDSTIALQYASMLPSIFHITDCFEPACWFYRRFCFSKWTLSSSSVQDIRKESQDYISYRSIFHRTTRQFSQWPESCDLEHRPP